MLLTLHFNINPVDGSVVPQYVQDIRLHIFLFITCMPAWIIGYIVGYMVSFLFSVPFPVMVCIAQFLIFGAIGKIVGRCINHFKTRKSL